jgi:hypothetical protein
MLFIPGLSDRIQNYDTKLVKLLTQKIIIIAFIYLYNT